MNPRAQRTATRALTTARRTRGWTVKTCGYFSDLRQDQSFTQEVKEHTELCWYAHCSLFTRVRVCSCLWFAPGVRVLPNIYCHNDVWLLREQGFHSREKRGWVDNRLGLPLCLCLNAQQIHIHALNMHTITHICLESLFIWVAYIKEKNTYFQQL